VTPRNDGLKGPKFVQYFVPIIAALKALGGSARPPEVTDCMRAPSSRSKAITTRPRRRRPSHPAQITVRQ
jgi:hypothetical protein